MQRNRLSIGLVWVISLGWGQAPAHATEREVVTCEGEANAFLAWSTIASLTPYWVRGPGKESITFSASDGRELEGILLRSLNGEAWGSVLVLQGNAMPARAFHNEFDALREAGLDVYLYDYRGYKGSAGKRRVAAMIEDYREILALLGSKYPQRFVYAISFGGVVVSNAIEDMTSLDLVVLDGVPARIASYEIECKKDYSPLDRVLEHGSSNLVIVVGERDGVIRDAALWEEVKSRGGAAPIKRDARHPFAESSEERRARVAWLADLLRAKRVETSEP